MEGRQADSLRHFFFFFFFFAATALTDRIQYVGVRAW